VYEQTFKKKTDYYKYIYGHTVLGIHQLNKVLKCTKYKFNIICNYFFQGHGTQVAFVLDMILGVIKRHSIDSEEFYQHLCPYTGRNTRQFMREFMAFARSPYHMAAYDRHSQYEPDDQPNIDSDSDSDHQQGL